MKLVIEKSEIITNGFCEFLLDRIKMNIMIKLDVKQLIVMNEYLNNVLEKNEDAETNEVNLFNVVSQAINEIEISNTETEVTFLIKDTKYVKGTKFKLAKMCNFIDFGTQDIKGMNLFSGVFNDIAKNITNYYNLYASGGIA